jgi:glycerol uptake facilitator-like aquaporin
MNALSKRLTAEALGSTLLACTVIGSGIMAEKLAAGNAAVALIGNTMATVAMLGVLIFTLGAISGAHFNPAVSFIFALRRELSWRDFALFVPVQIVAMIAGAALAHVMFGSELLQMSTKLRSTTGEGIGELIATFALVFTILATVKRDATMCAVTVPAAITAGYWFTSSTSFANPAITIARSFTESFSGIAPTSIAMFIAAQIAGALLAWALCNALFDE